MARVLKLAFGSILVLLVAAFGVLFFKLNSIVKAAVEEFAPKVVGVPVTLASVSLSPLSGNGSLSGLVIGNPPGYKSESAFKLRKVKVDLVLRSLTSDLIHVKSIIVDGPEITYEAGAGGGNLNRIRKNAAGASGSSTGSKSSGPEKRVRIDLLVVKNGKVRVSAPGLTAIDLDLPPLELKDIGKEGKGARPHEAAAKALDAVIGQALKVATGSGTEILESATKGIERALGGLFKKK